MRAVLIVVLLAGCGAHAEHRSPGNRAQPRSQAVAATPERLELSAAGLGGLTADTAISAEGVAALFPSLKAEAIEEEGEDGIHHLVRVSRGAEVMFDVSHEEGRALAIEVFSAEIAMRGGVMVGQGFDAAREGLGGVTCYGMIEANAGNALCWSSRDPNLAIVLPLGGDDEAEARYYDDEIPAGDHARILGSSKVTRLAWVRSRDVEPRRPEDRQRTR